MACGGRALAPNGVEMLQTLQIRVLLGVCGGVVFGIVGVLVSEWARTQGFLAPITGAMTGLGFGLAAQARHPVCGIVSGGLGLILSLATVWYSFENQLGLGDFWTALQDQSVFGWLVIAVGTYLAYSIGYGTKPLPVGPRTTKSDLS